MYLIFSFILTNILSINVVYATKPPKDYIYVDTRKNPVFPKDGFIVDIPGKQYKKVQLYYKRCSSFKTEDNEGNPVTRVDIYVEFEPGKNYWNHATANIILESEDGSNNSGTQISNTMNPSNPDNSNGASSYRISFTNLKPNTWYHFVYDVNWGGYEETNYFKVLREHYYE